MEQNYKEIRQKEIYEKIQKLEELIDNVKGDIDFIFDENIDEATIFDAYKAIWDLLHNAQDETNKLLISINNYSKEK